MALSVCILGKMLSVCIHLSGGIDDVFTDIVNGSVCMPELDLTTSPSKIIFPLSFLLGSIDDLILHSASNLLLPSADNLKRFNSLILSLSIFSFWLQFKYIS